MQLTKTLATSSLLLGFSIADSKCTIQNAVSIEALMASAGDVGGADPLNVTEIAEGLTNAGLRRAKRDDDNLKCTKSESCYSIDATPFCYNPLTAAFRAIGINGNALSGDYIISDGQTGNLYDGPYPTKSSGGVDRTTSRHSSTARSTPTTTLCLDSNGGKCNDDWSTSTIFNQQTTVPAITTVNGILTTTVPVTGSGSVPTAVSTGNEAGYRLMPKAGGALGLAAFLFILIF